MASKEELCLLAAGKPTTQDYFQRDIDDLVFEIKENLRLKSRPTHLPKGRSRVNPYNVPSRTESKCNCCDGRRCLQKATVARKTDTQNPYDALQELLKDGDLIKEAVRRLSMVLSPKQRCVYDSDDQLRTPPLPFSLEV